MSNLPHRLFVPGLAADSPPTIAQQFLELLNLERQRAGVAPLGGHPTLDQCARDRVRDMIDQGYFGHTDPLGAVSDEYTGRLAAYGVTYAWAGENLAMVSTDAFVARMVELWMASPGHRANILTPDFDLLGVGHGRNAAGTHLVAHVFVGGSNL